MVRVSKMRSMPPRSFDVAVLPRASPLNSRRSRRPSKPLSLQKRVPVTRCTSEAMGPVCTNGTVPLMPHSSEGFSPNLKAFSSQFSIRGYEVGPNRRASIVTIANLLQETGANHCVGLWGMTEEGFAIDPSMAERHLIWVLTRLQLQMEDYPTWGDEVEVETWLTPEGRAAANREFCVTNAQTGQLLGKATSIWVCVNTQRRRIVPIPPDIRQRIDPFSDPDRLPAVPTNQTRLKIEEIDEAQAWTGPARFAGHMNIDMNNHINNVAYLTWALDVLQLDVFENYQLKQLEIDFKAECEAGDCVESHVMELPEAQFDYEKQFVHNLYVAEDSAKKELIRLRTSWGK